MSVLIPTAFCRSKSETSLNRKRTIDITVDCAPPPGQLQRSCSSRWRKESEDNFHDLTSSLQAAALELNKQMKDHGYISLDLVGLQHCVVRTPVHFMIRGDSDVRELRSQIGIMSKCDARRFVMLFAGWTLLDGQCLNNYGITSGSLVVVLCQENFVNADEDEPSFVRGKQPPSPDKGPTVGPLIHTKVGLGYGKPCLYYQGRIIEVDPAEPRLLVGYENNFRANEWIHLRDHLRFDEILGGTNHQQRLLETWEHHASQRAWSSEFMKVVSSHADMITLESTDELRYLMPCGHAITEESLLSFTMHSLREGNIEILCPFVHEETSQRCNRLWTWEHIRIVLQPRFDLAQNIELIWSGNAVALRLNAQKCDRCGSFLFRGEKGSQCLKALCPRCVEVESLSDEKEAEEIRSFCWLCREPWSSTNDFVCNSESCRSSKVNYALDIIRNCDAKKIGRVEGVPSVRSCVHCGQLIMHWTYCKHIVCSMCKKSFCFVCLKPYDRTNGWACGSSGDECPVAPAQEEFVASFGAANCLDLKEEFPDAFHSMCSA